MEQKEMMQKFESLYNTMANSNEPKYMHIFGETMKAMMEDMIVLKPELASEYVETLQAIEWRNYLTNKESTKVIACMSPQATWDKQTWLDAMEALGVPMEQKPYYNDYALYVAMNQVASDHGKTIAFILGKDSVSEIETAELVKYAYKMAIDLLTDEDGMYNIRTYFLSR